MHVYDAMTTRRSIRQFLPDAVPRATLERIVGAALRAPSGHNTQPWKVYAVSGNVRDGLVADLLKTVQTEQWEKRKPEYDYYPTTWVDPFLSRKRTLGYTLYQSLGIDRKDTVARDRQMLENFKFFGAPVGLFITFDRRMATGTFLDVGMFIQSLMMGARAEGFDTCGQAIFTWVHDVVRKHVPIPSEELLACGIALGRADPKAPQNTFRIEKLSTADVASFHGFEG